MFYETKLLIDYDKFWYHSDERKKWFIAVISIRLSTLIAFKCINFTSKGSEDCLLSTVLFFFCRLCRYCSLHQIYFEMGETWNSVAGFFSKLAASNSHNKRRGIEKWQTRWWSRGYDCVNVFSTVTVKKWVRGGALSVTVIKKTPRLSVKNLSNSLGECSWDQLLMNWTKTFSNFVLRQTSYHIWFTDLPQIGYQFAISRTSIPFFSWCCFFFFLNL